MCLTSEFFSQCCARISPLASWTSTKALLLVGDYLNKCLPESPRSWPRGARTSSQDPTRSRNGTEICLPITRYMSEMPRYLDVWYHRQKQSQREMKPNVQGYGAISGSVAEAHLAVTCQKTGWVPVFSKHLSFFLDDMQFHNILPGSYSCQKGTFAHGWMSIVAAERSIWARDILFSHLADITILF